MTRVLALALLALSASAARGEWGAFEYDFDADQKPWSEIQAQLPPPPKAETLIPFEVSPAVRHRHFVDYASLSVGGDNVVRYTVVVRTEGGAENVSYEGMRCTTGERKLYAFGRPAGDWVRNRYARWERISMRAANSYQRELYFSYFCAGGMGEPDLRRIQHLLKSGGYKASE